MKQGVAPVLMCSVAFALVSASDTDTVASKASPNPARPLR